MELLDRYLQAVRFWLPRAQQNDIIAELGDDLRSQIEDRESSLGRPLSEDELVALLKQAGHPLWVAGRYQKQQALIGPVLFPLYSFVLKIVTLNGAAVRQSLSSAMAVASRRRTATGRFHRSLHFHLGVKNPSLPDFGQNHNADAQHAQALAVMNQVLSWTIIGIVAGICVALLVHAYQTVRELRRMAKGSGNGVALPASQTL